MKELQNYVMRYLNENCVHYDEHLAHVVSRIGLEFRGQDEGWQISNVPHQNAGKRHPDWKQEFIDFQNWLILDGALNIEADEVVRNAEIYTGTT